MKKPRVSRTCIRWILPAVSVVALSLQSGLLASGPTRSPRIFILFMALVLLLILLNFFVWRAVGHVFQRLSLSEEKALQKRRMEQIVRLSGQVRSHEEKVLRIHHDLKNHLGVLDSLLRDGRTGQAGGYIDRIRAFLEREDMPK